MSTVLWSNYLVDGVVTSDESDKYALHQHLDKIDAACEDCGLTALSELCDSTDLMVNLDQLELPDGVASTNDLMAAQGVWVDAAEAVALLRSLILTIRADGGDFGLRADEQQAVVEELIEALEFARSAEQDEAQFNFSIVM